MDRVRVVRLITLATALASGAVFAEGVTVPVAENLKRLLAEEDTSGDRQITVEDDGDKRFRLKAESEELLVGPLWPVSNLLIELGYARRAEKETAAVTPESLFSAPPQRLSRLISGRFWNQLTRQLDGEGLARIAHDPKTGAGELRIYVPHADTGALAYYRAIAKERPKLGLRVIRLPETITPEYVKTLDPRPGILGMAVAEKSDEPVPVPFVVPGGRFNEQYGWDSYFIALGLLADGRVELAKGMVDNFVYQIRHYGKILNANRSYYLTRSQPPFLTAMARAVYQNLSETESSREWLRKVLAAAIQEYQTVWLTEPRLTPTGLSRYFGSGIGMPPEVNPDSYHDTLGRHARRLNMSVETLVRRYNRGKLNVPALDEYFLHDRAMRESGHDSTWRLVGRTTDLVPVSLNALLYRYETDIAKIIDELGTHGTVSLSGDRTVASAEWRRKAADRKARMLELLWDPERGLFFDYDLGKNRRLDYVSATTLYPLWAGLLEQERAARLAGNALELLEYPGGIAASARGDALRHGQAEMRRQWDWPYGWAPHQMMVWAGLRRYGFDQDAQRLTYRWLHTVAFNAATHNAAIVEKYDVAHQRFDVDVEYGNVGVEFDLAPTGGFGWTNASVQVGLRQLTASNRGHLDRLVPPGWLFNTRKPRP